MEFINNTINTTVVIVGQRLQNGIQILQQRANQLLQGENRIFNIIQQQLNQQGFLQNLINVINVINRPFDNHIQHM